MNTNNEDINEFLENNNEDFKKSTYSENNDIFKNRISKEFNSKMRTFQNTDLIGLKY